MSMTGEVDPRVLSQLNTWLQVLGSQRLGWFLMYTSGFDLRVVPVLAGLLGQPVLSLGLAHGIPVCLNSDQRPLLFLIATFTRAGEESSSGIIRTGCQLPTVRNSLSYSRRSRFVGD